MMSESAGPLPFAGPQRTRRTRFVCISDTHNCTVKLPKGDVLIHCGDLTNQGSFAELSKQVAWLENADFECKLVIAGNHDLTLDTNFFDQHGNYFHNNTPQNPIDCQNLLVQSRSLIYLKHSGRTIKLTSPSGPHTTFNVFGSPYVPECSKWAFQYSRSTLSKDAAAENLWKDIPLDTDILVTHGPARTHRDETRHGEAAGCESLRQAMWRVRPRIALCGHVHEARGVERVRWDLSNKHVRFRELPNTYQWKDPGMDNEKNSLVDLTAKSGMPLDNVGSNVSLQSAAVATSVVRRVDGLATDRVTATGTGEEPAPKSADLGIGTRGFSGNPASARSDGKAFIGRLGRKETCVVNCALQASNYPHSGPRSLHKPIVIDIDLPVWDDNS
ncbi:Metallo-dependent phosphatase [Hypoxylon sp. NC1633]|nr:Metallo-dependent phosphatase [Hypoxylon sp. NC1633]